MPHDADRRRRASAEVRRLVMAAGRPRDPMVREYSQAIALEIASAGDPEHLYQQALADPRVSDKAGLRDAYGAMRRASVTRSRMDKLVRITDIHLIRIGEFVTDAGRTDDAWMVAWKDGDERVFKVVNSEDEANTLRRYLEVLDESMQPRPTRAEERAAARSIRELERALREHERPTLDDLRARRALGELGAALESQAELSRIEGYETGRLARKRRVRVRGHPRRL